MLLQAHVTPTHCHWIDEGTGRVLVTNVNDPAQASHIYRPHIERARLEEPEEEEDDYVDSSDEEEVFTGTAANLRGNPLAAANRRRPTQGSAKRSRGSSSPRTFGGSSGGGSGSMGGAGGGVTSDNLFTKHSTTPFAVPSTPFTPAIPAVAPPSVQQQAIPSGVHYLGGNSSMRFPSFIATPVNFGTTRSSVPTTPGAPLKQSGTPMVLKANPSQREIQNFRELSTSPSMVTAIPAFDNHLRCSSTGTNSMVFPPPPAATSPFAFPSLTAPSSFPSPLQFQSSTASLPSEHYLSMKYFKTIQAPMNLVTIMLTKPDYLTHDPKIIQLIIKHLAIALNHIHNTHNRAYLYLCTETVYADLQKLESYYQSRQNTIGNNVMRHEVKLGGITDTKIVEIKLFDYHNAIKVEQDNVEEENVLPLNSFSAAMPMSPFSPLSTFTSAVSAMGYGNTPTSTGSNTTITNSSSTYLQKIIKQITFHSSQSRFLPPEQSLDEQRYGGGERSNPQAFDCWALGVILLELLLLTTPGASGHQPNLLSSNSWLFALNETSHGARVQSFLAMLRPQPYSEYDQKAVDLMVGLLSMYSLERMTIDAVLSHPWLASV